MEYQNFKLEIDEQGIAVFTANRPEKMNALNDLSWAEMNQFFTRADKASLSVIRLSSNSGVPERDFGPFFVRKEVCACPIREMVRSTSKPPMAPVAMWIFLPFSFAHSLISL